jgi:fructose-1,6-bisphosphatase/inositol monophosphatase family enzyme
MCTRYNDKQVYVEYQKAGALRSNWGQKGFLAINATTHHEFQIGLKRTRALGSISTNLVYTARGMGTATLAPKAYLWDLVAGATILTMWEGSYAAYLAAT